MPNVAKDSASPRLRRMLSISGSAACARASGGASSTAATITPLANPHLGNPPLGKPPFGNPWGDGRKSRDRKDKGRSRDTRRRMIDLLTQGTASISVGDLCRDVSGWQPYTARRA